MDSQPLSTFGTLDIHVRTFCVRWGRKSSGLLRLIFGRRARYWIDDPMASCSVAASSVSHSETFSAWMKSRKRLPPPLVPALAAHVTIKALHLGQFGTPVRFELPQIVGVSRV